MTQSVMSMILKDIAIHDVQTTLEWEEDIMDALKQFDMLTYGLSAVLGICG